MGKLIYSLTTSLDGFAADANGGIDWSMPSEEVHSFVNDSLRNIRTFLFGRKVYEVMTIWDSIPTEGINEFMDGPSEAMNDFAKLWRLVDKVVYSKTLTEVTTAKTTIERVFDPLKIKKLIAESPKDVGIGGPHLAAEAIKADIVDEYHQFIVPILLGDGLHWLPKGARVNLKLVDLHKFDNGFLYLRYRKI
jgi:dihydrofolate reductase